MYQVAPKSTADEFHQLVSGEIAVLRHCYAEALDLKRGCKVGRKQWLELQECTNSFVRANGFA